MNAGPSHPGEDTPHGDAATRGRAGMPRFQISLTLMLLSMVVFAAISAALYYAARVPAIREELSVLIYDEPGQGGEDVGRFAHRAFLMFTFSSPLLLACLLSVGLSVIKRLERRGA